MRADASEPSAVEVALANAERRGFRLAVIGRTAALVPLAGFYLTAFAYPRNIYIAGVFLVIAAVGLLPLALIGSRAERAGRYAIFTVDMAAISILLAFVPLSASGEVPQSFVFLSGRHHLYYIILAVSGLTLSPALVLWTGFCAAAGLAGATAWIASGMARIVSYSDLPLSPSLAQFLAIAHDPDFFNIPVRTNEAIVIVVVTGLAALVVHRARNMVRAHADVEAERSRVQQLFGRYVPTQVAEQLVASGQLAPQSREASVLFADIEGFTRISEHLPPARLIGLLDSFFGAATKVIDDHDGVVVNHLGDALIAAFNAPLPLEGYPAHAVGAARALQSLVSERDFDGHRLRLRIGVATGPVAAGTIGGATRQTYTLYGDTVNLAQRLERLNKKLATDCLICGTTFKAAQSGCTDAVAVGSVRVRGRAAAVEVFALGS